MKIRFWGTRGSIATPAPGTNRYGGNTSCVGFITSAGQRFIFDWGTGARLLEVDNGADAMRLLKLQKPDLVALDLFMPSRDDLEILRWMRADAELRDTPVVVLTAHEDAGLVRKCFELGATDYLVKPLTPPQLDARVRSNFGRI